MMQAGHGGFGQLLRLQRQFQVGAGLERRLATWAAMHSSERVERTGFAPDVDESGWPVDPLHPTNVAMRAKKSSSYVRKNESE
jgi:hypothetical protein